MLQRIISLILLIVGFAIGYQLVNASFDAIAAFANVAATPITYISASIFGGSVFGFIFYIITPVVIKTVLSFNSWTVSALRAIPTQDIVVGIIGLVTGLLISALISVALIRVPLVGIYLSVLATLFFGYFGLSLMHSRKDEMTFLTGLFTRQGRLATDRPHARLPKILDTSVIIDGRIVDISATGFIEGTLIVPGFVLEELRHIADSSDTLKRNRGRRGLDILNKIQKEAHVSIQINEQDFEDIPEVDSKLVKLAQVLKGIIVTNDYNLNKVCELHGVSVLNINELANAVKPVLLPGEEIDAQIIKDGKEAGQGLAYLDDGTMIVVEGGRRYIGDTIEVVVTSVLQTAAGRMIFAKPKVEKISGIR